MYMTSWPFDTKNTTNLDLEMLFIFLHDSTLEVLDNRMGDEIIPPPPIIYGPALTHMCVSTCASSHMNVMRQKVVPVKI